LFIRMSDSDKSHFTDTEGAVTTAANSYGRYILDVVRQFIRHIERRPEKLDNRVRRTISDDDDAE